MRRSINLIPFGGMLILNGAPNYNEIIYNVLAFVPFGIFLCMLRKKKSFVNLILPIALTSMFYEAIQYIFVLGASDITDLIANTFGGIAGIGIFYIFHKIRKRKCL
jgi:glycopeptide antibiotics resistance protein